MIKLTLPQIAILESIDDNGLLTRPRTMKPATATKVVAKLIAQKLVREIRAKAASPIWREDADGRTFSLKVLKAGRDALSASLSTDATSPHVTLGSTVAPVENEAGLDMSRAILGTVASERPSTKRFVVLTLMRRQNGATIDDLISATGWLPHTTRAALTGLRKQGIVIERQKEASGGASVYRVLTTPISAAA